MKIYGRIKQYRLTQGLIQKHVAKEAGISSQRLSAIENGTLKLSADEFEDICIKGLKINPAIFFTNEFLNNEN